MKYLNELQQLDSECSDNIEKASQKTIDFVQETVNQFNRDFEEEPIQDDELGAINYEISILLEVWDPALKYDIEILKRLDATVTKCRKQLSV